MATLAVKTADPENVEAAQIGRTLMLVYANPAKAGSGAFSRTAAWFKG
jgi:hypothetical protein